jgi:O-antigen ligase
MMFPESARGFGQPSSYLTLVVWVVVLLRILHRKERLPFLKNKALLFMFLFWLVAGISISQSSQVPLSAWVHAVPWISGVKQFVELTVALSVAFFTVFFVRSWRDFRFAMTSYFAGWIGSVSAQLLDFAAYFSPGSSLLQAANDFIHHSSWWQFVGPFPRLRLSTAEGSWASDYLICVIPFFVLRAYYWKSRAWNFINALASVLVLFATMSFGGLVVFVGQVALMAVILGRRAVGFLALAGAAPLLLALAISPVYVSSVWNRAAGAFVYGSESGDGSMRLRAALAETSWATFKEHPWLGVGIGVSNYYVPGDMPTWAAKDPYVKGLARSFLDANLCNLVSQVLSETGLAGTALFVLLLATMAWGTLKAYQRATEGWKKSVYAAILVALLGQIAHYTSMNTFHFHYWCFIWGLAIFAQENSKGQTDAGLVPVPALPGIRRNQQLARSRRRETVARANRVTYRHPFEPSDRCRGTTLWPGLGAGAPLRRGE